MRDKHKRTLFFLGFNADDFVALFEFDCLKSGFKHAVFFPLRLFDHAAFGIEQKIAFGKFFRKRKHIDDFFALERGGTHAFKRSALFLPLSVGKFFKVQLVAVA